MISVLAPAWEENGLNSIHSLFFTDIIINLIGIGPVGKAWAHWAWVYEKL
jgi:hypothetical protein